MSGPLQPPVPRAAPASAAAPDAASGSVAEPASESRSRSTTALAHESLLPPAHAAMLLDEVLYEQVLECVDLDALVRLERSLVLMIGEIDEASEDRARDLAMSMIDRAVLRLPDDVRGYLKVANLLSLDCELCEEESRQQRSAAGSSGRRRAPRAS